MDVLVSDDNPVRLLLATDHGGALLTHFDQPYNSKLIDSLISLQRGHHAVNSAYAVAFRSVFRDALGVFVANALGVQVLAWPIFGETRAGSKFVFSFYLRPPPPMPAWNPPNPPEARIAGVERNPPLPRPNEWTAPP